MSEDPSRVEAVEAARLHEEVEERTTGGREPHVAAAPHSPAPFDTNPNAGVRRATPPDGRALAVAAVAALLTLAVVVVGAVLVAKGH